MNKVTSLPYYAIINKGNERFKHQKKGEKNVKRNKTLMMFKMKSRKEKRINKDEKKNENEICGMSNTRNVKRKKKL